MQYIGRIDKQKFKEISEKIITEQVILTEKQENKNTKTINIVLRLAVESDNINNKNSIITCIPIGKNRLNSYKNNGKIVYKNE